MDAVAGNMVFVLDHDPDVRMEVCHELSKVACAVRDFERGDDLIAALDQHPAVCVLEMEAPNRGGLDICKALRSAGDDKAHVILTSRNDNIQLRLSAFDVGCNDYFVKPLVPEELVCKIDTVLRTRAQLDSLSSRLDYATTTAFSAMSTMAEMGTVMNFMRGVFECRTSEQVAHQIIDACRQYDLNTLTAVSFDGVWSLFNAQGEAGPLEQSLLEHARSNDRITQFAGRLSISYPQVTLLVTNWPKCDDDGRAGRLRDHLAFVAEAANICLSVLQHDAKRLARTDTILQAVNGLMRMVDYLRERQEEQRNMAMRMIADQGEAIAQSFYRMGLSDAQEQTILNLVSGCGSEICEHLQSFGHDQARMLGGIIDTMKHLAED